MGLRGAIARWDDIHRWEGEGGAVYGAEKYSGQLARRKDRVKNKRRPGRTGDVVQWEHLRRWEDDGGFPLRAEELKSRRGKIASGHGAHKGKRIAAGRSATWLAQKEAGYKGDHMAKDWALRSPEGRVYFFENLSKFLRDNKHLFEGVLPPSGRPRNSQFSHLRYGRRGSWHGWTWAGDRVEQLNGHADLLGREDQP